SFKLLFVGMDFINALISFSIAFSYRYSQGDFYARDIKSYVFLCLLLAVMQVIVFISIDLYHPRRGLSFTDEFLTIFTGVFLNLFITLSLIFFFRGESFSRVIILSFTLINVIVTTSIHSIFRSVLKALRRRGYNLRWVIILGTGSTAVTFSEIIKKHTIYGYVVAGFLKTKVAQGKKLKGKILGSIKELEKIIKEYSPDMIVYALSAGEGDYLQETIDICDFENIDLKVVPSYSEFIKAKGRVEDMDGLPIISIRNIPIRLGYNRFIKRSFDFLFSLVFIILFSPVYALIAIAIKFTSDGPVFLKQERVGLDNKSFDMLKFRTMFVQEQKKSDTVWTKKDDPRVTAIGRLLRKLSLDETPQFFNVLTGSMSVVGPRPERPFFVEQFKVKHKKMQYMRRHSVKAGITGWAQVNGLRGDTSIEQRIEADIFYIENWSLFLDLKIILLTPFKGILSK
ncbi:MAG: undecaprenyl-phosphate glucose phosphotransferase, partial [Leptospira sp.]|nr:undecaprenyl-phosphate glucose phosphotransferase [Leptospira sp.]